MEFQQEGNYQNDISAGCVPRHLQPEEETYRQPSITLVISQKIIPGPSINKGKDGRSVTDLRNLIETVLLG